MSGPLTYALTRTRPSHLEGKPDKWIFNAAGGLCVLDDKWLVRTLQLALTHNRRDGVRKGWRKVDGGGTDGCHVEERASK